MNNNNCNEVNENLFITLGDYIKNQYLEYHNQINRENTIRSESYRLNIILEHELSKKLLHLITVSDIELFLNNIRMMRKLSLATVNRYKTRLSAIFHHAVDNGYITNNIIKKIKDNKEFNRDVVLSNDEIKNLLLATRKSKNKTLYLIVVIALNTGMRKSEILGLKRSNIQKNYIKLMEMTTKSGYGRNIPINDTLQELLAEYILSLPANQDTLFCIKDIKSSYNTARSTAMLPEVRIHDLRRTFATHLKDNNVNIYDIKEILGHSSITMTEKYLKQNFNDMQKAVNTISFC